MTKRGPIIHADLLGDARYDHSANELAEGSGLYLDLPAAGRQLFALTVRKAIKSPDR